MVEMAQARFPSEFKGNTQALVDLAGKVHIIRLQSCAELEQTFVDCYGICSDVL